MNQKYYYDKMNAAVTKWAEAQENKDYQAALDKMYFIIGVNPYNVMFPDGPSPGMNIYTLHSDYGDVRIIPTRHIGDDYTVLVSEL